MKLFIAFLLVLFSFEAYAGNHPHCGTHKKRYYVEEDICRVQCYNPGNQGKAEGWYGSWRAPCSKCGYELDGPSGCNSTDEDKIRELSDSHKDAIYFDEEADKKDKD